MPNILALDTSAGACSAALNFKGLVHAQSVLAAREHTKHILPMVDAVLQEASANLANLDAIAFGAGPGSFTGLRIACGIAQGLGFGANLPLVPVSSLAALAADVFATQANAEYCLAAFDARMQQIYAGVYRNNAGIPQLVGAEVVIAPDNYSLPTIDGELFCAGSGMEFRESMPALAATSINYCEPRLEVSATAILTIAKVLFEQGQVIDAADAQPIYLRQQISWQKQS